MDYYRLKILIKNACPFTYSQEIVEKIWNNPGKEVIPIPENHLLDNNHRGMYHFLRFDYRRHHLEYVSGKIDCCGIEMNFKLEGYNRVRITTSYDAIKQEIVNYALIIPIYNDEHWIGKKSMTHIANIVRSDRDFIRYKHRIDKRFSNNRIKI
jgi:hypothetical protein